MAWLPASSKITGGEVIRYTWYGIHAWSMATVVAAVSVLLLPGRMVRIVILTVDYSKYKLHLLLISLTVHKSSPFLYRPSIDGIYGSTSPDSRLHKYGRIL